jgi:hypothetical protein
MLVPYRHFSRWPTLSIGLLGVMMAMEGNYPENGLGLASGTLRSE